ncbi:MAG: hypothetical protein ABI234_06330 [Ktedonobacteraceae bacterium]
MQEWTNPQRMSAYQPARKVMTYTILCFSLAGLIFGFAAGGFLGRGPNTAQTPPKSTPSIVHHMPSPAITVTPTPENIFLDDSIITHIATSEKADSTTSYTFSAQPVYKGTNKPIDVTDVTCRLWLTKDLDGTYAAISANKYAILHSISGLTQPFPLETPAALVFTPTVLQVQPCSASGSTTWTYTLSPTVTPGTYYLFVLADWKGTHFNTSARQIQVTA